MKRHTISQRCALRSRNTSTRKQNPLCPTSTTLSTASNLAIPSSATTNSSMKHAAFSPLSLPHTNQVSPASSISSTRCPVPPPLPLPHTRHQTSSPASTKKHLTKWLKFLVPSYTEHHKMPVRVMLGMANSRPLRVGRLS